MRVAVRQEEAHKIEKRLADGEDPSKLAEEYNISEDMVMTFTKEAEDALGKPADTTAG